MRHRKRRYTPEAPVIEGILSHPFLFLIDRKRHYPFRQRFCFNQIIKDSFGLSIQKPHRFHRSKERRALLAPIQIKQIVLGYPLGKRLWQSDFFKQIPADLKMVNLEFPILIKHREQEAVLIKRIPFNCKLIQLHRFFS
ncbi:Uncharacterised protein [Mycobacteroides abscessus subsp. abscessus]|nr:Uncharacterised protein [Mycobacteroides abscessus subsp. abscessus]